MSATRRITHRYAFPIDAVTAILHDADSLRARSATLGERDVDVTVNQSESGVDVAHARTTESDLPAFVKKLTKGENRIQERTSWRRDGEGWVAEYQLEIVGTPAKIQGKSELRPDGDGCQYVTEFVANADVPLIGGKVANIIADKVELSMLAGVRSNEARLTVA